jgi:hypothetical protein
MTYVAPGQKKEQLLATEETSRSFFRFDAQRHDYLKTKKGRASWFPSFSLHSSAVSRSPRFGGTMTRPPNTTGICEWSGSETRLSQSRDAAKRQ